MHNEMEHNQSHRYLKGIKGRGGGSILVEDYVKSPKCLFERWEALKLKSLIFLSPGIVNG